MLLRSRQLLYMQNIYIKNCMERTNRLRTCMTKSGETQWTPISYGFLVIWFTLIDWSPSPTKQCNDDRKGTQSIDEWIISAAETSASAIWRLINSKRAIFRLINLKRCLAWQQWRRLNDRTRNQRYPSSDPFLTTSKTDSRMRWLPKKTPYSYLRVGHLFTHSNYESNPQDTRSHIPI